MKRTILTFLAALILATSAWAANPRTQIKKTVSAFRNEPGVEVVDLGSVALSLLRGTVRMGTEDNDDRIALELLKGIKHMTIVDFDEAAPETKAEFTRKIRKIMSGEPLLMEATDDGERVSIWGVASNDGEILQDIILLAGNDALISLSGTIRLDQIGELLKMAENQ